MFDGNRRRLLKALTAAGAGVLSGVEAAGQGPGPRRDRSDAPIPLETLQRAAELLETGLEPDRVREILPSVQRNADFFRVVRELEIPDDVEPAPRFHARPGSE
jgi:hypothetical protein